MESCQQRAGSRRLRVHVFSEEEREDMEKQALQPCESLVIQARPRYTLINCCQAR